MVWFGELLGQVLATSAFLDSQGTSLKERLEVLAANRAKEAGAFAGREKIVGALLQRKILAMRKNYDQEKLTKLEGEVVRVLEETQGLDPREVTEMILQVKQGREDYVRKKYPHFPSLFLQGQVLAEKKIEGSIGEKEIVSYLRERFRLKEVREIKNDLLYFLRNGLGQESAARMAALFFELRSITTAPAINETLLKNEVIKSLKDGRPLDLVHIKSLRYTYPEGEHLEVLDYLEEVDSPGKGGERRIYPGERVIFEKLRGLVELFRFYEVKTRLTILVADNDLGILFPEGNSLVAQNEIEGAKKAGESYITKVIQDYLDLTKDIFLLTEYLKILHLEAFYEKAKRQVLQDVKGKRLLVKDGLVEERVSYQFGHYREMFGPRYTRGEARLTAYHQIANLMVLSVVFESFPGLPIVVIDDRGRENNLIGGFRPKSRAIFFTKFKEQTKIEKC